MRAALVAANLVMVGQVCVPGVLWAQSPTLSIVISMPNTAIRAATPIQLGVSMTNGSNRFVLVPSTRVPAPFSGVTIRNDATGQYVKSRLEAQGDLRVTVNEHAAAIRAGQTVTEHSNLRWWFDLGPGQYAVCVKKKDPVTGNQVVSNTVEFTVK